MRIKFLDKDGDSVVLDNVIYFGVASRMARIYTNEKYQSGEVWLSNVNNLTKEQSVELDNLSYRAMVVGFADLTKTGVTFKPVS